jgi:hypothetical protein
MVIFMQLCRIMQLCKSAAGALLLLASSLAAAQFTLVTATVVDPNGTPYALGTVSAQLITNGVTPTLNGLGFSMSSGPANLDTTGSFTMSLVSNTAMVPTGLHWQFTVCSSAGSIPPAGGNGPVCFTALVSVTGANQNISSILDALAPALSNAGGGSPSFAAIKTGTNTTATMTCGTGCSIVPAGGGVIDATSAAAVPWPGVTAGANPAVLTEAVGGSQSSATTGQIAGTQLWLAPGVNGGSSASIIGPVVTVNPTGGFYGATALHIVAWFSTALGSTLPTPQVSPNMSICGGITCSVTVDEPAAILPGYTTWTVGSGVNSGVWDANAECTNVPIATTTCTITTTATGASAPIVNSAWIQPSGNSFNGCPPGVLPSLFQFDSALQNYALAGTDFSSNNGRQVPTLDFCTPIQITDQETEPVDGDNSLLAIDHEQGQYTAVATNQDRALWVNWSNSKTPAFAGLMYGAEAIQAETDFYCTGCTFSGVPDTEVAVASFQLNVEATSYGGTSGTGTNTVRADWIRAGGGQDNENSTYLGVMDNGSATNAGGTPFSVYRAQFASASTGCAGCIATGYDFYPDSVRWQDGNDGFRVHSVSGFTPSFGFDWAFQNEIHNYPSMMDGPVYENAIWNSDQGALPINASVEIVGSLSVAQIPSGWNSNGTAAPTCSGGASIYSYVIVAVGANGGTSNSASENTPATCTNPLTSANPVTINFGGTAAFNVAMQSATLQVWRTGGPMADGLIGTITCFNPVVLGGCSSFLDTGLAATGTLPTGNSTGGVFVGGNIGFNTSAGQHFNQFGANGDSAGVLTCSAGAVSLTFAAAYASTPVIIVSDETTSGGARVSAKSATAFTVTCIGVSDVVDYMTAGNPN